jgi:hypothetical protein
LQQIALHASYFSIKTDKFHKNVSLMPQSVNKPILFLLLLAFFLFGLGCYSMTLPNITRFMQWPFYMIPRGEILILASFLLVLFCGQCANFILFVSRKLSHLLAFLLVFMLIGADGIFHMLSIPHIEGWWLPLASALLTGNGIIQWLKKYKNSKLCTKIQKNALTSRDTPIAEPSKIP